MDREKRRKIAFAGLLVFFLLLSLLYFFWGTVIDYGTVIVKAEAPFKVDAFGEKSYQCDENPCELKMRAGAKTLILQKADHDAELIEIDLGIWQTEELIVDFRQQPQIVSSVALPNVAAAKTYILLDDELTGMQKLVDETDSRERAIVFFQKPLKDARVFSSGNFAFIQSESQVFKIDVRNNRKESLQIDSLENLNNVQISPGGDFAFVQTEEEERAQFVKFETNETTSSDLNNSAKIVWLNNNEFAFVTNQSYSSENLSVDGEFNYIQPLLEQSAVGITFGTYDANNNRYRLIDQFSELQEIPDSFIPLANGNAIYFSSGDEIFKIIF